MLTSQEIIQTFKTYSEQAIKDYHEMAQEDIDNNNERRANYWNGIAKGWENAFNALEEIYNEE